MLDTCIIKQLKHYPGNGALGLTHLFTSQTLTKSEMKFDCPQIANDLHSDIATYQLDFYCYSNLTENSIVDCCANLIDGSIVDCHSNSNLTARHPIVDCYANLTDGSIVDVRANLTDGSTVDGHGNLTDDSIVDCHANLTDGSIVDCHSNSTDNSIDTKIEENKKITLPKNLTSNNIENKFIKLKKVKSLNKKLFDDETNWENKNYKKIQINFSSNDFLRTALIFFSKNNFIALDRYTHLILNNFKNIKNIFSELDLGRAFGFVGQSKNINIANWLNQILNPRSCPLISCPSIITM